jgi:type VI secretion system protein ImpF
MLSTKRSYRITPSLLDNLTDEEPEKDHEPVKSRYQQLLDLRASVRHDLENLLNTRRPVLSWPIEWQELNTSLVAYGAPDIMSKLLDTNTLQNEFCDELTKTLQNFEPRLKNVQVKLLPNPLTHDQTLRLRVVALLSIEPAPEPIVLDSIITLGKDTFTVVEGELT